MSNKLFFLPSFSIIIPLFLVTSCTKDDAQNNKDQKNASFIKEYWTLNEGKTFAINNQNNTVITATLKPEVFAYEFLADGTFKSHDLSGNGTPSEIGIWTLEIKSKDVAGITSGTLALTSPSLQTL